ncbi:peptidoglycan-binding domain-containing protein [Butyrivibrio sp. INlla21]|uniref:peptidoglycan-binding domain-containing protein n=1 Tax=Butyrivibrio sp. INlla21 TaxID=1520811 RepID=UPI0008F09320|nr:peptidoglycan-binding domain-containing protein [Butyrivibrio sp. INlla21]SFU35403.1 Putative peptidoglycan binding domain-containing protein [Butyrivibrio sp. INlla21]
MSTIVHASCDENRKIKGGAAGDQTGKEVCTRSWYSKPWSYVLRPKDPQIAEKAIQAAISLAKSNKVGYDQNQRNTLYNELKKHNFDVNKIGFCETDCSAFVTACYIIGGIPQLNYTSNAPTTSTMVKTFLDTGYFEPLTDAKYLKTDMFLKRGDILVKPGAHTVMVVEVSNPYKEPTTLIKKGSKGDGAKWVQWQLACKGYLEWNEVDGEFGPKSHNATVTFQKANNLEADGIVGPKTREILRK